MLADHTEDDMAERAVLPLEAFLVNQGDLLELLLDQPVAGSDLGRARVLVSPRGGTGIRPSATTRMPPRPSAMAGLLALGLRNGRQSRSRSASIALYPLLLFDPPTILRNPGVVQLVERRAHRKRGLGELFDRVYLATSSSRLVACVDCRTRPTA